MTEISKPSGQQSVDAHVAAILDIAPRALNSAGAGRRRGRSTALIMTVGVVALGATTLSLVHLISARPQARASSQGLTIAQEARPSPAPAAILPVMPAPSAPLVASTPQAPVTSAEGANSRGTSVAAEGVDQARAVQEPDLVRTPEPGPKATGNIASPVALARPSLPKLEPLAGSQNLQPDDKIPVQGGVSLQRAEAITPDWLNEPSPEEVARYFPRAAWQAHQDGSVLLRCLERRDGFVEDCQVLHERPFGLGFGKAVLQLSREFRFRPVFVNGEPVETMLVIPYDLSIQDDDDSD